MMFKQLREELRTIKDRKFHRVPDPENFPSWKTPVEWPTPPPPSYQSFMEEFGPVSLYRELSYWRIYIYAHPVEENDPKKGEFLRFGGTCSGMASFRRADLGCRIVPVYATQGVSGLFLVAESFEEWLETRMRSARKGYKRAEWKRIVEGPPPFTEAELEIVAARRQFRWTLLMITPKGRMTFVVRMVRIGGCRGLPYVFAGPG